MSKKITQKECVLEALKKLNGVATLSQLYHLSDTSFWKTKTSFASIRRIVQTNSEFFKIQPGLWGLSSKKREILKNYDIKDEKIITENEFTHSYYQGIVVKIGNIRKFKTYIPPQDKNKYFLNDKLCDIANLTKICDFTYPKILKFAKTIDVIWFNERYMPHSFYEIEHSTDFKNSINKFYELQDFRANFFIVAKKERLCQFNDVLGASIYKNIKNNIKFADYETIIKQFEQESIKFESGI